MKKKLGFLLFDDFEDLDFMGPWEILALWSQGFNGPDELFIITESGGAVVSSKGLAIQATNSFLNSPQLDYLLIPGGDGVHKEVKSQSVVNFIKQQSQFSEQILSVCTGVFLLQAAGLLVDKRVTTYWAALDRLRKFSELNVLEERFVNDGNIWTSAGISAGIDMSLAFIAKLSGERVAGDVQLHAEYYPDRKIYPSETGRLPSYFSKED